MKFDKQRWLIERLDDPGVSVDRHQLDGMSEAYNGIGDIRDIHEHFSAVRRYVLADQLVDALHDSDLDSPHWEWTLTRMALPFCARDGLSALAIRFRDESGRTKEVYVSHYDEKCYYRVYVLCRIGETIYLGGATGDWGEGDYKDNNLALAAKAMEYLSCDGAEQEEKRPRKSHDAEGHSTSSARKSGRYYRYIYLGSGVRHQKHPSGLGAKNKKRFLVRGHFCWQPCGPGNRDRKRIWRRPHWKGTDDMPLSNPEARLRLVADSDSSDSRDG